VPSDHKIFPGVHPARSAMAQTPVADARKKSDSPPHLLLVAEPLRRLAPTCLFRRSVFVRAFLDSRSKASCLEILPLAVVRFQSTFSVDVFGRTLLIVSAYPMHLSSPGPVWQGSIEERIRDKYRDGLKPKGVRGSGEPLLATRDKESHIPHNGETANLPRGVPESIIAWAREVARNRAPMVMP
jgi:hypothetical protein